MGTSKSPQELANKLSKLAKAVSDDKAGLNAAGLAAKRSLEGARAAAGVSAKKARMSYKVKGDSVIVRSHFPGWIINNPTVRHIIGARNLGTAGSFAKRQAGIGAVAAFGGKNSFKTRSTKKGKRALGGGLAAVAGGPRPYAFHPGTGGKGFWQRGRAQAQKTAPKAFQKEQLSKPLKELFR